MVRQVVEYPDIQQAFPDLLPPIMPEDYLHNISPQKDHDQISCNGYYFKVARSPASSASILREAQMCELLQHKLSVEVPNPVHIFEQNHYPFAGFAYKEIQGSDRLQISIMRKEYQDQRGPMLANLWYELQQLHNDPLVRPHLIEYQPASEELLSNLPLDRMKDFFSGQQMEIILEFTKLCTQELSQPVREPRFVHGDFWTGNMVTRPDSVEVIGLLDFSRCWLADPIVDMAKLSLSGTNLVEEVLIHYNDHYEPLNVDQCLLHTLLHRGLFVLIQIIQTGDLPTYHQKLRWWVLESWRQITKLQIKYDS